MRKIATVALAAALLGGCSGAQYMLPQLSEADISRASLAVQGDASSLPKFTRSMDENHRLINSIANRLAVGAQPICTKAGLPICQFPVLLDDSEDVNAYANEKQEIHISTGLMKYLESEEEVAAVIGHEMGHHIAEHVDEGMQNMAIGAIAAAVLAGAVLGATGYDGSANDTQQIIGTSMAAGAMVGRLSFSKEQEREADLLSAYILERSNYDLRRAGRVFAVLSKMNAGQTRSTMFDTHPAGPERVAAWEKAIAEVEASPDKLPRDQ